MKSIIFAAFLLCLAGTAAAQQGWVPLTSGTTARLYYLSLIGSDTIYASGGTAIRSTDGGATWDSLTNMPSYRGVRMTSALVQFVDDSTGFLCGSCDTVYKTTNGGQTWFPAPVPGIPGGFPPVTMVFKTRFFGCLTDGYGRTARTTDGGATWQEADEAVRFTCMAFADTLHGFGMGRVQPWPPDMTKPYAAGFAATTEGAAIWNLLPYAGPSADGKHSGIPKNVRGLDALSIDTLIAVGDYGLIARTYSAGIDWDTIPSPTPEHLNGVYFPDHAHGTAVGSNGIIIHTSDGGLIWTLQNSGITDGSYLYDVKFVDSLIGYTIGDGGIILKTINGGLSWVNISPLSSNQIKGIVFPQPASENTSIAYNLPETQHVTISIQNIAGTTVLHVLDGSLLSAGPHTIPLDIRELSCGTYFVHIQTEKYFDVVKFQVLCQ